MVINTLIVIVIVIGKGQLCSVGAGCLLVVCWSWPLALCKPVQNSDSDLFVRRLTLVCRCCVSPDKNKCMGVKEHAGDVRKVKSRNNRSYFRGNHLSNTTCLTQV